MNALWTEKQKDIRSQHLSVVVNSKKLYYGYVEHVCKKCGERFSYIPHRLHTGKIKRVHSC